MFERYNFHCLEKQLYGVKNEVNRGRQFKIITASSCVPIRNFDYQKIAD